MFLHGITTSIKFESKDSSVGFSRFGNGTVRITVNLLTLHILDRWLFRTHGVFLRELSSRDAERERERESVVNDNFR